MVSDKMKAVSHRIIYDADIARHKYPYNFITSNVAQEVVNAAWHKFHPDDESTWPTEDKKYLVMHPKWDDLQWQANSSLSRDVFWKAVTHYADPQDLMFKGDE